jgi:hypothetical protein
MQRFTRIGDGRRVQTCRAALPRQNCVQRLEAVLRLVRALPAPEHVEELLGHGDRVGRVERDHRDRDTGVEHLVCGEGVAEDVELGDRVGGEGGEQVALRPHGAAGDVDALHVPSQVRPRRQEERQVGVRAEEEHGGGSGGERVRHHMLRRRLPLRPVPASALREEAPPHSGVRVGVEPPAGPRRHGLPVPAAADRGHALRARTHTHMMHAFSTRGRCVVSSSCQ